MLLRLPSRCVFHQTVRNEIDSVHTYISESIFYSRNQKSDGQYKMRSRTSVTAREEEEKKRKLFFFFLTFCLDEEGNQIKRRKLKCISDGRLL
jgi:hypothetical protein